MTTPFSEKDAKFLALVIKTAKAPVEVDLAQLAELAGLPTKAAANTQWYRLKKKIADYLPTTAEEGGSGGDGNTVPATPVKATPAKKRASTAKPSASKKQKRSNSDDDDDDNAAEKGSSVKKAKPTPKKVKDEVVEEGIEAGDPAANDASPMKKEGVVSSTDEEDGVDQKVAETKKPKATPKKTKDPNAPKRAQTANVYFNAARRGPLKEANPGIQFGEIAQKLGAEWKSLTAEERAPYEAQAALDKERYQEEKAAYTPDVYKGRGEIKDEDTIEGDEADE